MKKEIDIANLITKAQALAHDGRIIGAEKAEIPIQLLETEYGAVYQIKLTATLISNSPENCNCPEWNGLDSGGNCSKCGKEKTYNR
jgi:hypothetical protein